MKLRLFDRLIRIDFFLLDSVVQPAVDWLGRRWGVDFVKLGVGCCAISLVISTVSLITIDFRNTLLSVMMAVTGSFLIAFIYIVYVPTCRMRPNPNRYRLMFLRLFQASLCLFDLPLLVQARVGPFCASMLLTLGYYILSCQTPPPQKKREPFWSRWFSPVPEAA